MQPLPRLSSKGRKDLNKLRRDFDLFRKSPVGQAYERRIEQLRLLRETRTQPASHQSEPGPPGSQHSTGTCPSDRDDPERLHLNDFRHHYSPSHSTSSNLKRGSHSNIDVGRMNHQIALSNATTTDQRYEENVEQLRINAQRNVSPHPQPYPSPSPSPSQESYMSDSLSAPSPSPSPQSRSSHPNPGTGNNINDPSHEDFNRSQQRTSDMTNYSQKLDGKTSNQARQLCEARPQLGSQDSETAWSWPAAPPSQKITTWAEDGSDEVDEPSETMVRESLASGELASIEMAADEMPREDEAPRKDEMSVEDAIPMENEVSLKNTNQPRPRRTNKFPHRPFGLSWMADVRRRQAIRRARRKHLQQPRPTRMARMHMVAVLLNKSRVLYMDKTGRRRR